jgi:hypothetical protein
VKIKFTRAVTYDKTANPTMTNVWWELTPPGPLVATCVLVINASYIDVTWTFVGTSPLTKTGRINTSANLINGDYRYLQVGLTLTGNVVSQPRAWAEVRLGSRGEKLVFSDIMTSAETGVNAQFLMNCVTVGVDGVGGYCSDIDDVYICNDEGEYNNTFLGSVKVRRVSVSGDGSENNSVPFGETHRFNTVNEDFIDTVNNLPVPLPNHETTPLFIEWEQFAGNYLTVEEYGDRQLMRFTSLNAGANYSKIHGSILTALLQPLHLDTPATLKAVRKFGIEALTDSLAMDAPLIKRAQFESRQFVWENEETIGPGEQYLRWTPAAVDASEWGFELVPVEIAPESYDPAIARINLVIEDLVSEVLEFSEVVHRYFEELIDDTFDAADEPSYERVFPIEESLVIESVSEGNRGVLPFLEETFEFVDLVTGEGV